MPISGGGVGPIKRVSASGMPVKKISSGGSLLWSASIPRQGVLKQGTQQLSQNAWEKVVGFKADPAFPDTDIAAAVAANGLSVGGPVSFVVDATMATTSGANQTRGVQVRGNGLVLGEKLDGNSTNHRTVRVVVPDGAGETLLELYALAGSSITSYRVLAADTTKLSYRRGSYYELLNPATFVQGQITEAPVTPNDVAEWPRVPGSGIWLEAGTYELIWNLYTTSWGIYWSVGCRVGGDENQVIAGSANSNSWNRPTQTITVPTAQYVMPTVQANGSEVNLPAGNLNLFIVKT